MLVRRLDEQSRPHRVKEDLNTKLKTSEAVGRPCLTATRADPESGTLAGRFVEVLFELPGLGFELFAVRRGRALHGDIGPHLGVVGIDLEPLAV